MTLEAQERRILRKSQLLTAFEIYADVTSHIFQNFANPSFAKVLVHFFQIIFCPSSWFTLKQLDNLPSSSMNDSQLGCASLTINSQTTRTRYLIVK